MMKMKMKINKSCANCKFIGTKIAITNFRPYCYKIGFIHDPNTFICNNWRKDK